MNQEESEHNEVDGMKWGVDSKGEVMHHRLRGSASPVLTATHHSYGSPKLSDFFSLSAAGVRPLNGHSRKMAQTTCFHTRMCLLH